MRVWLVLGDKAGDNGQVRTIGQALCRRQGWVVEERRVEMLPQWVKGKPKVEASLHHLDLERSDPMEPPWPDLVVTIGRRPSMVALWIKQQSDGRTRIVRVGKPTGRAERFDLVIASSEVQVPPLPHVLKIGLPLMQVDADAVAQEAAAWRPRLASLGRPLIGILVGGATGPYRFDAHTVDRLLEQARRIRAEGGTPYVTTSRRTAPEVAARLEAELPEGSVFFGWSADAKDNPYRALLGLADGLIVTGDSISMIVEVARLGKPLQILPLSYGKAGRLDLWRRAAARGVFDRANRPVWRHVGDFVYGSGLATQTRDFEAFHAMLLRRGMACRLGGPFLPPRAPAEEDHDLERVIGRIDALFQQRG